VRHKHGLREKEEAEVQILGPLVEYKCIW